MSPSGEYNFTTVTCTKIHDRRVPFFHEFVQYQKTLGVDHVHVSILDLFIKDKGFQDLVINDTFLWKEYMNGYLSFSVWKEWYAEGKKRYGEVSYHSEILRKLDCIYRFLGTYDFAMPLDTDDFLVPRIPGKTKLKDYILQYCYSKPAGSCRFKWIWHYPQCGINGKVVDGNVTKHLKTKIYNPYEVNFKSVHSTRVILDASFHDAKCPKCLRPGYHLEHIPTSIAYVAHNRYKRFKGQSPCANKGPFFNIFNTANLYSSSFTLKYSLTVYLLCGYTYYATNMSQLWCNWLHEKKSKLVPALVSLAQDNCSVFHKKFLMMYTFEKNISDNTKATRCSVEHCTPHADGAWLNELGWSQ